MDCRLSFLLTCVVSAVTCGADLQDRATAGSTPVAAAAAGLTRWVDPFLGVDARADHADGAVFPGATLPFGMLKAGPDMLGGQWSWLTGLPIDGFSQTHVSGTGGGAEYGNILIQPTTGSVAAHGNASTYLDERAHPGFFHVRLLRWGVDVDIAAARRSALYRFSFSPTSQANITVDAGHILSSGAEWAFANDYSHGEGEDQRLVASEIDIVSPTEVAGSVSVKGGWNRATRPYRVYFYAVTDTPAASYGVFANGLVRPAVKSAAVTGGVGVGAWFAYGRNWAQTAKPRTVLLRIAISFISVEVAKATLAAELPDFDFDRTLRAADQAWQQVLAAVQVDGATDSERRQLYTGLYHMMLMPTDRSGENPLWVSPEPSYDDFYAIWDIFRTTSPFLSLIAADRQRDIVRALLDIYRHEGWLPDARKGNFNGITQGGSNADVMFADALARGVTGVDWQDAYAAVRTDAERTSEDPLRVGRRGIEDWKALGYVAIETNDVTGSRQVEYALDDWCVAQLARHLSRTAEYKTYLARSGYWRNLFDPNFESEGFRGFVRPRHRDGSWVAPFNPTTSAGTGGAGFYEDGSWAYSFFVPHDVAALITAMGGPNTFVRRLDHYFATPGRYYTGNEPSFMVPYLYLWAGRHDRSAQQIRSTLSGEFNDSRSGLPGNDDSGAMSAWYVEGLLGLYPNAGSDVWLIGSPSLPRATLSLAGGKRFVIEAQGVSPIAKYVASATLNAKPLRRAWLHQAEITRGGVLRLLMSPTPGHWAERTAPPSASRK